jgi:hypothetical protein
MRFFEQKQSLCWLVNISETGKESLGVGWHPEAELRGVQTLGVMRRAFGLGLGDSEHEQGPHLGPRELIGSGHQARRRRDRHGAATPVAVGLLPHAEWLLILGSRCLNGARLQCRPLHRQFTRGPPRAHAPAGPNGRWRIDIGRPWMAIDSRRLSVWLLHVDVIINDHFYVCKDGWQLPCQTFRCNVFRDDLKLWRRDLCVTIIDTPA